MLSSLKQTSLIFGKRMNGLLKRSFDITSYAWYKEPMTIKDLWGFILKVRQAFEAPPGLEPLELKDPLTLD